jgi:negative regulator of flagellin synthesis FlgM
MIKGIGGAGLGRIDAPRADAVQRGASTQKAASATAEAPAAFANPAAEMAAAGPPIDAEKIAAIRAAIAEGRYPIDPQAIAEKMIALDLPAKDQ